ncbi:restriction endonuclease subunit S [Enterococcus cecorum]|uniref:restriction endonuclease subunit S n=1 Tax=Enterococcus cecorum TaxID=44008 RepID=UPI001FADAAFD|nr:restriction endonuclease subunit S [Enterococcus cecorum]MCJ0546222.1 restriction endonuclease subunit S [Enterococcus cecorum]
MADKFGFVGEKKNKKLGEICHIVSGGTPSRSNLEYWDNGNIPWIKIGDIKGKYINSASEFITRVGLDNSSAKLLKKGTILYTIFATLGEVGILDFDACTNQAIAGITIKEDINVLPDYLYYYLKSIKNRINKLGRGVAQNNINLSILKNLDIAVIEVNQQKEIIKTLDCVDSIIRLHKKELELLDTLIKARFVEMFGDPVSNSYRCHEATLMELGELGRGVSKHRPRNDSKLLGGKYPLIQTGDVANSGLYITSYNSTYSELGLKQSKMWNKGTLCITIAANIAKTAILEFDACFPDSIVGFIAGEQTNNIFIHYWFSFFQKIIETQAPESAQKNINLKILSELKVIVPEKEKQNEFAAFVQQIDKLRVVIQKSLDEAQYLFDSLMQEYFG